MANRRQTEFWTYVDKSAGPDGCWPWTRGCERNGYGRCKYHARRYFTHRLAYILSYGEIPERLCVLHSCDNPPCCNPKHLRTGTVKENAQDMVERGRAYNGNQKGSGNAGSRLTEAQVIWIRTAARIMRPTEIARHIGISQPTVSQIIHGRIWKHLLEAS